MAVQLVKWGQNIPMEGVKARSLDYLPHKETAVNSLCGRFQGNIPTPYPQLPRHAQRSPMKPESRNLSENVMELETSGWRPES